MTKIVPFNDYVGFPPHTNVLRLSTELFLEKHHHGHITGFQTWKMKNLKYARYTRLKARSLGEKQPMVTSTHIVTKQFFS